MQSMAIFIAILGLVPLSRGFSLIVGLVLNIEGEFVPYIVGVTLMVQNFSEIFCIDFVGLFGSKCILFQLTIIIIIALLRTHIY